MKYLITGGAGFIGSHLARALLKQGHAVDVLDNLSAGSISNLSGIENNIRFYNADIRSYADVNDIAQGHDGIFHYAALTSVAESYQKEKEYFDVNVSGTKNIFDVAEKTATKVVFASSSAVYGNTKTIPTPESEERNPANPYGITKLEAERLAEKYRSFEIVGLRFYNVYGNNPASSSAGVISKFYQNVIANKPPQIEGSGKQLRDFVFVDDVTRAAILAMQKNTGSVFVNIGSGSAISILELANLFIRYSKKDLKPLFVDEKEGNVMASQADISLAGTLLGWRPETTLEEWVKNLFT